MNTNIIELTPSIIVSELNCKSIKRDIKATSTIFRNSLLSKKSRNNPNKNKINGILFPESRIEEAKKHIEIVVNINLVFVLFFSVKAKRSIKKKEKFCTKPPAMYSSPKKLVL